LTFFMIKSTLKSSFLQEEYVANLSVWPPES
jgi:hypothetical protein